MSGDTPKCTAILDVVEAEQRADVLSELSQFSAQFTTVIYNGHHCQSADGSAWLMVTDSATMASLPTISRVTMSNTLDSGKHAVDKGNSGNSLGLGIANNLIVLCLMMLRFYE